MDLLQNPGDRGYPAEYLLTRIRGRRSRLIADWKPLVFEAAVQDYLSSARYQGFVKERSPENLWQNLVKEYRWVYTQMNGRLRRLFHPYFLYTEFRTLFICLRSLKENRTEKTGELLDVSLLANEIKDVIRTSTDVPAAVQRLESIFLQLSNRFEGLTEVFEAEGLRGAEQKLTNTYLSVIVATRLHPIMKTFFARLIDSRNIMTMYKHLRLEQKSLPPLVPGGSIPEARIREVAAKEDVFGICSLIREFFRMKIDTPDATKVEITLYKAITAFLKKEGREPFGIGPILDYLWKCSLEVMNLNVLYYGRDLERDAVTAELVQ